MLASKIKMNSSVKVFTDLQILEKAAPMPIGSFTATSSVELSQFLIDQIGRSAQEHGYVFFLNVHNKMIGYAEVGKGNDEECNISMKAIMQHALLCGAHRLLFAHNHPSDNVKPSEQDIAFSRRLKKAAELLDMQLIDSMVIGRSDYFSMAEEDIL